MAMLLTGGQVRRLCARANLGAALWRARRDGDVLGVALEGIPRDEASSYAVQDAAVLASGHPRLGWKVGSTSQEAQRLLASDGPGSAPLLAPFCLPNGSAIHVHAVHQPQLEGEFVLRFGKDLPVRAMPYEADEVMDAIDAVAPGLEIVGSRRDGGIFGQGGMMANADFGTNIAFTHGEWITDWRGFDLAATTVDLAVNGQTVASGTGAAALGSPLHVATWLANHLSDRGIGVRSGELVSTGTCTGLQPVRAGDTAAVSFGPLGIVHARFVEATTAVPQTAHARGTAGHGICTSPARESTTGQRAMHAAATAAAPPRVMLITGASMGVGAALARMADAQGFSLALVARGGDALEAVAAECPGALPIVADVTVRAEVERAVSMALDHFGGLDVLVNNVGRGIAKAPSEVNEEDIDAMMAVNVKSALFGMQAVLPHFCARDAGHIINISSRLGRIPSVLPRSAYNWSKHFLNGLTANFRDEIAATHPGIAVSLVSPGLIYTDFGQNALHDGQDMRSLPGGQTKEEVASVIMQVVHTRQPDVLTRPGGKAELLDYFDALAADVKPNV